MRAHLALMTVIYRRDLLLIEDGPPNHVVDAPFHMKEPTLRFRVSQLYNYPSVEVTVIQQFPADAKVLWSATFPTCFQEEIQSAAVGKGLTSKQTGDPQGMVLAEFSSVGMAAFDPSRVIATILRMDNEGTAPVQPGSC